MGKDNHIIHGKNEKKETSTEDDVKVVEEAISNIVRNQKFNTYNVIINKVFTDGGNYMAVLYEVDLTGTTKNGDMEINLFVKKINKSHQLTVFSPENFHKCELFVHGELFKIFEENQEEANIPTKERYNIIKYYDESNSDIIILHNLARDGFKTIHRMETMSLKFAELTLQQLARYHGLSFVLETKRPDYFNQKVKTLKQPYAYRDSYDDWVTFMKNSVDLATKNIKKELREKSQKYFQNAIKLMIEYTSTSSISCLVHGDLKTSNILTKENNGEVSEVILIDFQEAHVGSPILDILLLIFTGTDRKFRKSHLEHLKELYYNTLEKFLNYFNMSAKSVYPRAVYEKDFKEKLPYGLIWGVFMTPFSFTAEKTEVGDKPITTLSKILDDRHIERVEGIIEDFIEWGYL